MLIPTKRRSQIAHELSYPVGAEMVSEALAEVPQFELLTLTLRMPYEVTPAHIRQASDSGGYLCVFDAAYRNVNPGLCGSQDSIERGWYDEAWELSVYPVLRENKAVAREALRARGLPAVRDWLATPRPDTWRIGRRRLAVRVRPADGAVEFDESPKS
jgi:hypothetical protein